MRICENCKAEFTLDTGDFAVFEKMNVPPPTWCPPCRFQRRLLFLNNRELYKRVCGLCGKSMVTMYAPESRAKVYCNHCWWSDRWDGAEYARDYDPSRPFLEQVRELYEATPQMALETNQPTLVNSDYVNHSATAKNCYLIFGADECENVLYSELMLHNKDSMDSTMFSFSELCYGLVICGKCFRAFFSEDCESCHNIYFSKDCAGCSDCFGCVGLRNKRYHIWNQPYSKEAYQERLKEMKINSYRALAELKKKAQDFWLSHPRRFTHALRNANVTGEYVYESKNSKDIYDVAVGIEDSRYTQLLTMSGTKDACDYTLWGNGVQRVYEVMVAGEGVDNIKFSFQIWPNAHDIEYSTTVMSSSNMFGCANIRNKQYCILNKEYTKADYEALRERIIRDMNERPYMDRIGRRYPYGEFFPPEFSLFGYNETYAADFFPLDRAAAEQKGFSWYEAKPSAHVPARKAADLPDTIAETDDAVLQELVGCADCGKAFRIISAELAFLRRFDLPAPRQCPNCRYKERWRRINMPGLHHRVCQCKGAGSENGVYQNTVSHLHGVAPCAVEFQSAYAPNRPEIVYCEQCYNAEVV